MRRISILNFKGGVGKTSLATNIAYALSRRDKRILLVDCDLQANASSLLPEVPTITLTHVLKGEATFSDAIKVARDNLDILPADTKLNTAANHIVANGATAYNTLRKAIRPIKNYDFILFDHSPNYSSITETALLASSEMLIPCELAPYSVSGLINMITKLTDILNELDHEVSITGIVPFKLDHRYSMTEIYLASLQKRFGELIIHPVRTDSTIARAQSLNQTVFEYDQNSKAAEDFATLAQLLLAGEKVAS